MTKKQLQSCALFPTALLILEGVSLCGCVLFLSQAKRAASPWRLGCRSGAKPASFLPSFSSFFTSRAGIEMSEVDTEPHAIAFYKKSSCTGLTYIFEMQMLCPPSTSDDPVWHACWQKCEYLPLKIAYPPTGFLAP